MARPVSQTCGSPARASEAREHQISLTDWLQGSRLLRRFFLSFSDPSWAEVAKNLCVLGVLSLQHLAPENAWSGDDLAELVELVQREGWPEVATKQSQDWLPPWGRRRKVFAKPSGRWRTGSSEPLHRVMDMTQLGETPSPPSSPRRQRTRDIERRDTAERRKSSADKEAPVPSTSAESRCSYCDYRLVPDARFCPKCGRLRSRLEAFQWPASNEGWTVRTSRLERGGWAGEVDLGKAQEMNALREVLNKGAYRTPSPRTRLDGWTI